MNRRDLDTLNTLLYSRASAVVPMRDIFDGNTDPAVIGLRHDVDDNARSLDTALRMAEWEHRNGYRATYYLLHDAHYWDDAPAAARELVAMGHEVGLHNNALAEALRQGRAPFDVLRDALHKLRRAVEVVGTVAHGDQLCYGPGGSLRFVNDEVWMECRRPALGAADRLIDDGLVLEQRSLWDFGLKYDANWLSRADYLSDSGDEWSQPVADVAARFPRASGQLHMLVHPDWWSAAFADVAVAA